MLQVIQSPAKYLQGPDASALFGQYAKNLADSFFVIADDFVMKLAGDKVLNGLHQHDIICHAERFNGECSHVEINRLIAILKQKGCKGVVGIGGGKPSIPQKQLVITRNCQLLSSRPLLLLMRQPARCLLSTPKPASLKSTLFTRKTPIWW